MTTVAPYPPLSSDIHINHTDSSQCHGVLACFDAFGEAKAELMTRNLNLIAAEFIAILY